MAKKRAPKKKQEEEEFCDCPRCRLREAIMIAGAEETGLDEFEISPPQLAMDIAPTIAEIMAWLPYEACEEWWMVIIEARARVLSGDAEKMPAVQGRA